MWNAKLHDSQTGIKFSRRNTTNLRYADETTQMAESEEKLKSILMRVKEESEKNWLETQRLKKTKITATGPITSWQIERGKLEAVTDLNF